MPCFRSVFSDCFNLNAGGALGLLLLFYQPSVDGQRLASVARVFVAASKTDAFSALVSSYNAPESRPALLFRLKALAQQCFLTLSWHRHALAPALAASRPAAPLDRASGGLAGALLECVLLLVSPDPYAPVLGKPQAATLAAGMLTHMADNGMCGHLFLLLAAALLPPVGAGQHVVAAKPYVEALVTQLVVRLLSLKSWAAGAPEQSMHNLLFVPDLWRRCASLQPVAPRVARLALGWLAAAGPRRLATLLPPEAELPGGGATAVAVLLSNVLAVGPRLLQPDKSAAAAPASLRGPALSTARVLHAVVSLLPLSPFFVGAATAAAGDDDDDEVDEGMCASLGLARLTLPPGAAARLPAGLVEQVQGLTGPTGRQLLKQLVTVLLPQAASTQPPASSSPSGGTAFLGSSPPLSHQASLSLSHHPSLQHQYSFPGMMSPPSSGLAGGVGALSSGGGGAAAAAAAASSLPSTASLLEASEGAHAVCELVWQLAQLPGQQQRVMLALAVSAEFVERMWWSFLRPARLAELAGISWLPDPASPTGTGTAAGGSPWTTRLGSASSSYNCAGPAPMELELPMLGSSGAGGNGPMLGRSSWPASVTASDDGAGPAAGAGAGSAAWRPRVEEEPGWLLPLAVTCSAFAAHITTATLEEFYGGAQRPLALQQLYDAAAPESGFLAQLRDALWQVLWSDAETCRSPAGDALYAVLARAGGQLYGILYERNSRRAFCPTETFHATALAPDRFLTEAASSRSNAGREDGSSRVWQVLRHAPYLVPFADRARLFQLMVGKEREEYRAQEDSRFMEAAMLGGGGPGNRFVPIRRDQLLFDGFDRLNGMGERLRGRVRIMFIDAHGQPEAGVDGGGLFKDFLEELMRAGLSSEYGLFAANASHQLYPNPAAMRAVEDAPRLLAFLGRMLGKALYENVLLELPLAGFFLKKFRGAHCDLNDLPTLDPELYRNLLLLREHFGAAAQQQQQQQLALPGQQQQPSAPASGASSAGGTPDSSTHGAGDAADAMDLGLTFVVADDAAAALGDTSAEVELKPGGRLIPVTADNVREYIHRVAHYKLNISPRPAVSAFLSGFYELIPRSWVSMFSGEELQTLISGSEEGLDLDDMAASVEYAGGYHEDHPVIHCLWEALASFTPEEQGKFLKFITSCSRPPLLGFRYLEPRLCIQMSGSMLDPAAPQRLPTASTCMNLLKLPPYRTTSAMREKLLYAINSGAGFDLS
ncbi:hypothetical protein GPECTOR_61g811 [Gonium pectorale]|uniref:HECT-type E3 ubiquitin transferase n=1 Tax=Gonium pectorale TaxID=33097 RepID=A0A150G4V6_GONPE|nr:hypothetical protein GPECTOR_61g811 [Gonium pectorale]|eukprot:KXZ44858.1 hypothetical protein GPECTOR_61g811 [Gonium pectorale]